MMVKQMLKDKNKRPLKEDLKLVPRRIPYVHRVWIRIPIATFFFMLGFLILPFQFVWYVKEYLTSLCKDYISCCKGR